MEDDGFQLVSRVRRRKSLQRPTPTQPKNPPQPATPGFAYRRNPHGNVAAGKEKSVASVVGDVERCMTALRPTPFVQDLLRDLREVIAGIRTDMGTMDCVSYGLGSFGSSRASVWQFALLLCVWEGMEDVFTPPELFDPVFTDLDKAVAGHYKCLIIPTNERGARPTTRPTLFYMPHCGHTLYDAVLRSNWSTLPGVVIIGNSFATYSTLLSSTASGGGGGHSTKRSSRTSVKDGEVKTGKKGTRYLLAAVEDANVVERAVGRWKLHPEVFNNTSLHSFRGVGRVVGWDDADADDDPADREVDAEVV
ncbi:uncharacterized protein EV422DRAFT_566337 [Fimicolochytrium jonesii]|uniref:uncharacterized protein n=1 Tax=Fimicolochytrium jonesii TaxID=1396493 RepID=UPI0022FEFABC|nr:uncharacterized protein EV422DRAFT_566337 [Fimicolochytrium jonesii]KAI8822664.1 hypothetical protein EV422DRAFT_566337 [Fimicolochytrium jonesii]